MENHGSSPEEAVRGRHRIWARFGCLWEDSRNRALLWIRSCQKAELIFVIGYLNNSNLKVKRTEGV